MTIHMYSDAASILSNQGILINNPKLSDVVLKVGVDAVHINAHSILLASQSSYYSAALDKHWNQDGVKSVVLSHPDIQEDVMMAILGFIYTGKIEVCVNDVSRSQQMHDDIITNVMEAADYLDIPHLFNLCLNGLSQGNAVCLFKTCFNLARLPLAYKCIQQFPVSWIEDLDSLASLSEEMIRCIVLSVNVNDVDVIRWKILVSWATACSNVYTDKSITESLLTALLELSKSFICFQFSPAQYADLVQPLIDSSKDTPTIHARFSRLVEGFKNCDMPTSANPVEISKITDSVVVFTKLSETIARKDCALLPSIPSSIVSNELFFQISCQTNTGQLSKVRWNLLFRASDHGFDGSAFHSQCDNKGPTICLIKVLAAEGHSIAAAYNSNSWISNGEWEANVRGFIVGVNDSMSDLTEHLAMKSEGKRCETVNESSDGPHFCFDDKRYLEINDGAKTNCLINNLDFLGKGWTGMINVVDYEVFQVVLE